MAGLTIHLAMAKEYIRKSKKTVGKQEFYRGVVAPDFNESTMEIQKDKSKTHYGIWRNGTVQLNIDEFLKDTKVEIQQDFWKGYLFHLLSDYYFYHTYFTEEHKKAAQSGEKLYHDYDCLNKVLLNKYQITPVESLKKWMSIVEGQTKYLQEDKIIEFIEEISSIDLERQIRDISKKGMEGVLNEY